jgi:glucose-1-phosphate thymidylyltransferase
MVGLYKLAYPEKLAQALEWLREADVRTHGEFQLTDALMHLIEEGEVMTTCSVDNWFDCGRKEPCSKPMLASSTSPNFWKAATTPNFPIR